MKQTGKLAAIAVISALMALSLSMSAMAAKHSGTVVRKKACVITIIAPKETGECRIGPNDPPVKVVTKGWYWPPDQRGYPYYIGGPPYSAEYPFDPGNQDYLEDLDSDAFEILAMEKAGLSAWSRIPNGDSTNQGLDLEPPKGGIDSADAEGAYTREEAMQYMKVMFTWVHAWKAYRGKEYGVIK